MKIITSTLFVIAIFGGALALHQWASYKLEGGVFVSDKYANPPLSSQIYYRGRHVADSVNFKPGMGWISRWSYWRAFRKFPTLTHCLQSTSPEKEDLQKFKWKQLRTNTQVQVCLYHVGSALKDREDITEWVESQGFHARVSSGKNNNYLPKGDFLHSVRASWSKAENGTASPYPIFSQQTFEQFDPIFLMFGRRGEPTFQLVMDNKYRIYKISIRNLANK